MDFSRYFGLGENKEMLEEITNEVMEEVAYLSGKKAVRV